MEFDKKDKRLISYLYHNYREPLTKIGKACRMSRDQVEYKIKKYENQGLIKKYLTIFNYDLLGYHEVIIVWIKLKDGKETIKKELEKMNNVLSIGDILSKYDLFVNFIFKNKKDFEEKFYQFIKKYENKIENYSLSIATDIQFYPLKFFGELNEEQPYEIVGHENKIKLTEKDLKLLKVIEKNGREKIINLSAKTGLSSELIIYKLKQFRKNKIILGTRLFLGMENFGFYFAVSRLKLKNLNEEIKNKIKNFCKNHKNINALFFGVSDYNCQIQSFYQKEDELRQTLRDINNEFPKEIFQSELLLIENEGRVKTLPF